MSISFHEIRLNNDIEQVVTNHLGIPDGKFWNCPFHDDKTPSFTLQTNKKGQKYWRCFGCGKFGDVIDFVAEINGVSITQAVKMLGGEVNLEVIKERQEKWETERHQKRQDALQRVQSLADRVLYYKSQLPLANGFWFKKGLSQRAIETYQLGYAPKCPTCPTCSSYVIPVLHSGNLVSIRHRLTQEDKGKYRPEFAGLPPQVFLSQHWYSLEDSEDWMSMLTPNQGLLVEGEIKAMVLDQYGLRTLGIPGVTTWFEEWVNFFDHIVEIFVCLDPGVEKNATMRIVRDLISAGKKVFVCDLPAKPDDMFVIHNAGIPTFMKYLEYGRIMQ